MIWASYFIRETVKTALLILLCFFGLYLLIDISSRIGVFRHLSFSAFDLALYYGFIFVQRLDIMLPFAFLVASLRTLLSLNVYRELVALLASGISKRRLMRPFLAMGFVGVFILYTNAQFIIPLAVKHLDQIEIRRHDFGKAPTRPIQSIILQDGSYLIYQAHDDLYWIRSADDIYRMKGFSLEKKEGLFVDHLLRDASGVLTIVDFQEKMLFPTMQFDPEVVRQKTTPAEGKTLPELWQELNDPIALASFMRKLISPWFCLFGLLALIPSCFTFSRTLPVFRYYLLTIVGLLTCYLVLNAGTLLAEAQVLSVWTAIVAPFGLLGSILTLRYLRSI